MRKLKTLLVGLIVLTALSAGYLQSRQLHHAREQLAGLQPGYIDVSFSQFMSLHHEQAIAMAQLMLDGRPTGLSAMARNIASAQLIELGEMRGWLRLWKEGFSPASLDMTWMLMGKKTLSPEFHQYVIDCGRAPSGMVGLASPDEFKQLREL
ncbi:MAG: DUF305 domain-containing protein, partial [Oceanisphaera sp.]|nr:DUF305 domain-containing protein [Oceanisphaera sp.]